MFDVDYFKKINDTYGHDIGDRVLQVIADIARKEMRQQDILARFGGEEFIVLLSETAIQDALSIADRIRNKIQNKCLFLKPEIPLCFTVSVGICELKSHKQNLDELIKQADLALYQAKENGRNCVIRYEPSMSIPSKLTSAKMKKPVPIIKSQTHQKERTKSTWSIL